MSSDQHRIWNPSFEKLKCKPHLQMCVVTLALPPSSNFPIIHCPKPGLVRPDQEISKPLLHKTLSTFPKENNDMT